MGDIRYVGPHGSGGPRSQEWNNLIARSQRFRGINPSNLFVRTASRQLHSNRLGQQGGPQTPTLGTGGGLNLETEGGPVNTQGQGTAGETGTSPRRRRRV